MVQYLCAVSGQTQLRLSILFDFYCIISLHFYQAGTKVGPDQLGPPVRVGSTRIDSDCLKFTKKNIKLNEMETFTHFKVKILVKSGPH